MRDNSILSSVTLEPMATLTAAQPLSPLRLVAPAGAGAEQVATRVSRLSPLRLKEAAEGSSGGAIGLAAVALSLENRQVRMS